MLRYGPKNTNGLCLHRPPLTAAPPSPVTAPGTAYFLPDSMNLSYSTAILQDRAWRLWAAEQLVLMTFPKGRDGGQSPAPGYPTPPCLFEQRCFTTHIQGGWWKPQGCP